MGFNGKKILCLSLFLILSSHVFAQDVKIPDVSQKSIIIPGPVPFSLDGASAVYCIDLLRINRFLEVKDAEGISHIVKVKTVWSFYLGLDENYPAGHKLRYDIILNGSPLDWDNSFIEYGGKMINLRLLFLYRNQYPPQGLEYGNGL